MAPQPTLMFVPSGLFPIVTTCAPEPLERRRPNLEHRPVRAVDRDPAARPEARRTARRRGRRSGPSTRLRALLLRCRRITAAVARAVEQRLDRLLLVVLELPAAAKELHAVVLAAGCATPRRPRRTPRREGRRRESGGCRRAPPAPPPRRARRRAPARARGRTRGCPARRARTHPRSSARTPHRGARRGRRSARRRRPPGPRRSRSIDVARASAWRTAAPCAPCAGRPSCARRRVRRGSGSPRA